MWKVQMQKRDASGTVIELFDEEESARDIAKTVHILILLGWTLERTDAVSMTWRSSVDARGNYRFRHYWYVE